jgi:hypothetical protein
VIWLLASAVLVAVSGFLNWFWARSNYSAGLDLWASWIKPAITKRDLSGTDLMPGLVLSGLGLVGGFLIAQFMSTEGGRTRIIRLGPVVIDLNPRVWGWFLQEPSQGWIYRVRLKGDRVLLGQISEYTTNPNDDVQEIVLRQYSTQGSDGELRPVGESLGALISRDDIEMIERLGYRVASDTGAVVLVPGGSPSTVARTSEVGLPMAGGSCQANDSEPSKPDQAALLGVILIGVLTVAVAPGPYTWLSSLIGISLLIALLAFGSTIGVKNKYLVVKAMAVGLCAVLITGILAQLIYEHFEQVPKLTNNPTEYLARLSERSERSARWLGLTGAVIGLGSASLTWWFTGGRSVPWPWTEGLTKDRSVTRRLLKWWNHPVQPAVQK